MKLLKQLQKDFDELALKELKGIEFFYLFLVLYSLAFFISRVTRIPMYVFSIAYLMLGIPLLLRNLYLNKKIRQQNENQ